MQEILDKILNELPRYRMYADSCCSECAPWVGVEQDVVGDYVRYDELKKIIEGCFINVY